MLRVRLIVVAMASVLLMLPATSLAQSQPVPLAALLPNLYSRAVDSEIVALKTVFGAFNVQFPDDRVFKAERLATPFHIIDLAGDQLSSFPLGSASGGFSWTFDSASGAFVRASNSFGPVFAERALTIGRKRLNAGVNYQHVTFDHLDGRSLSGDEIVGYTASQCRSASISVSSLLTRSI